MSLINKRVLIKRSEFAQYINSNIQVEQQYITFEIDDFEPDKLTEIKKYLDTYNSRNLKKGIKKTVKNLLEDVIMDMTSQNEPIVYNLTADYELPDKFYSVRELKNRWLLKYDMDFYRLLEGNGAKKYHLLGDFVRYDIREFEKDFRELSTRPNILKIDIKSYLNLKEKHGNVVNKLLSIAIQRAKNLASKE